MLLISYGDLGNLFNYPMFDVVICKMGLLGIGLNAVQKEQMFLLGFYLCPHYVGVGAEWVYFCVHRNTVPLRD